MAALLACSKHSQKLSSGERAGFYLGDSPGVGKGRIIASVVFENILRGRSKERFVPPSQPNRHYTSSFMTIHGRFKQ